MKALLFRPSDRGKFELRRKPARSPWQPRPFAPPTQRAIGEPQEAGAKDLFDAYLRQKRLADSAGGLPSLRPPTETAPLVQPKLEPGAAPSHADGASTDSAVGGTRTGLPDRWKPKQSGQAGVLQFALPSVLEVIHYTAKEKDQREELDQVLAYLGLYNQELEKKPPRAQVLFMYIERLDRAINIWFDTYKGTDLKKMPNGPYMLRLHQLVETEHRRLVDFAVENSDDVIPVDLSSLDTAAALEVRRLWKSLVAGDGNLRVIGTKDFKSKIYANLARLLQGSYGRAMIDYLNKGEVKKANRTTIGADFDSTYSAHNVTEDEDGSYAFPRANLTDEDSDVSEVTVESDDQGYDVANNLDDINQIMLQGKPGVNYKGVSYTFGQGSGSLVKIVGDEDENPQVDKELNQILTPTYISLGHELGHAMRNRGGASFRSAKTEEFGSLLTDEEGQDDAHGRVLWTSSEELVNITTTENKLREEHGLSERSYHTTQPAASNAIFSRHLDQFLDSLPADLRRYVSGTTPWQTTIVPFLTRQDWSPELLTTARAALPTVRTPALQEARRRHAQAQRLAKLANDYSFLMTQTEFDKIQEVKYVKLRLTRTMWDERTCQGKIDDVEQFLKDKRFWLLLKVSSASLLTMLFSFGVWYFLYGSGAGGDNHDEL